MWLDTYNLYDNIPGASVLSSFRDKVFINLSQITHIYEVTEYFYLIFLSDFSSFIVRKSDLKKGFRRRFWFGDLL